MHLPYCLVMILLIYPAMADTSNSVAPTAPADVSAPAISKEKAVAARRAALEQRVKAKWDAMIRKDFASVYALTSPAYRGVSSLAVFQRGFSVGRVGWRRIEVVDIDFKGDDAAMVGMNVHLVYYQAQPGEEVEMTTYLQEPWIQVDGQWWYLVKE